MKKYLFIIDDLYGGGAEKVLLTVASGLAKRGHQINVWLLRDKVEHQVPTNIQLTILNIITPLTKAFSNLIVRKYQAKQVQNKLDKTEVDVLICCSSESITSLVTHPNQYFWLHADYGRTKQKHIKKTLTRYNNKKLICVSEGVKKSILDLGVQPKSCQVFWNPIDQCLIEEKATLTTRTHPNPYFVCVAALEERKGHRDLLKAFALSKVSDDLILLGKGSIENDLKKYADELGIAKQVYFKGFQKNPYPYIKEAKALLLTSRNEGAPLVLIEALMLNTTVAAMDCPSGPKEILTYANLRQNLTDLGDISAFSQCIKRLSNIQENIEPQQYYKFLPNVALKQFETL